MQSTASSKTLLNVTLGQALVAKGIITQDELDMALKMQMRRHNDYLGELLQSMGISQEKINKTMDYLHKRKKIGDILIDLGLISPEDLKRVLQEQKQIQAKMGARKPMGTLFFQMGLIKYADYMKALSKHFVLPIITLEDCNIPVSLQDVLGKKYVRSHQVLVLENDAQTIKIALGEPTPSLMQEIRKSFPPHKEIVFFLAHPVEIESAHKRMLNPAGVNRDL